MLSGRPVSSMTVGSDCSSTISSEDDECDQVTGGDTGDTGDTSTSSHQDQDTGSSSLTVIAAESPGKR